LDREFKETSHKASLGSEVRVNVQWDIATLEGEEQGLSALGVMNLTKVPDWLL